MPGSIRVGRSRFLAKRSTVTVTRFAERGVGLRRPQRTIVLASTTHTSWCPSLENVGNVEHVRRSIVYAV